jgi:hypothetical protein
MNNPSTGRKITQMSGISTAEFLLFLKEKFPVIHNSNFFFRDLDYGVRSFLESKGKKTSHAESERIARALAGRLVAEGIFKQIDHQSWCVNYPQFALPRQEKAAPEKAAAGTTPPAAVSAAQ